MSHKAAADGADVPWASKPNEEEERRMTESGSTQRQAGRNRHVTAYDMVTRNRQERYTNKRGQVQNSDQDQRRTVPRPFQNALGRELDSAT